MPSEPKPGIKTTELWAGALLSLLLVVNSIVPLGIEIDDALAVKVVGGLTAAYMTFRSVLKALGTRPKP